MKDMKETTLEVGSHLLSFTPMGTGYSYRSVKGSGSLSGYVSACTTPEEAAELVRSKTGRVEAMTDDDEVVRALTEGPQPPYRREERHSKACKACGRARLVKVTWRKLFETNAWDEPSWPDNCRGCTYLINARNYDELAALNRRLAKDWFDRHGRRKPIIKP